MKLIIDTQSQIQDHLSAVIEHEGETLEFDLSAFNRRALDRNDVCTLINAYWQTLGDVQQQKIFMVFHQIRGMFEEVEDTTPMILAMMPLVKKLYDLHNLNELDRWVQLRRDIFIPERFDAVYEQTDDKPFTRDRTYTRSDYMGLVALAVALRPMIPIWGHFIMRTSRDAGTDFKETNAFTLIAETALMESSAMQKLLMYIKGNLQDKKIPTNVLVRGVSIEDYPDWLLASVIVRRVCVGDVRGLEPSANLVVTIHNDLTHKNNPTNGSNFGEMIRDKPFEGEDRGEQGLSRIENYKIRAKETAGEIGAIKHYLRDPYAVASRLMPEMDMALLEKLLAASKSLLSTYLLPGQVCLAQWVLAPVVSPRGLYHPDKPTTLNAIVIAQAYLWQKGHVELAALITAIMNEAPNTFVVGSAGGSMTNLGGTYAAELEALFPYNHVSVKRKKTLPANRAVVAIEKLANNFYGRDWILTLPDEMAFQITGRQHRRNYSTPHDLRQLLAKLAIECAKRPLQPFSYLDRANALLSIAKKLQQNAPDQNPAALLMQWAAQHKSEGKYVQV